MTSTTRTRPCTPVNARARLKAALAYLKASEIILAEDRDEFASVAAGLAVLAGIAACDAICCKGVGRPARGDDHRGAADLVKTASTQGARHRVLLIRLLELKDQAHYGFFDVSGVKASRAVSAARELVAGAQKFL
jgi:hypothetical protein